MGYYKHFKIKEILIKNFKGARNVHLKRLGQFNIIVGPNGCGKSSILQMMAKAFTDDPNKNLDFPEAVAEFIISRDAGSDIVDEKFKVEGGKAVTPFKNIKGKYLIPSSNKLAPPGQGFNDLEQQERSFSPPFAQHGANNLIKVLQKCATECEDQVNAKIKNEGAEKWKKFEEVIFKILNKKVSFVRNSTTVNNYQILLDGEPLYHDFLSDGETRILQLLFRALLNDEPTAFPDILLIDEPELHLHPNNQIKLINLLRKLVGNDCLVFISTHSPYILSQFDISNVRYLSLPDENGLQEVLSGMDAYTRGLVELVGGEEVLTAQKALFNYANWGSTYQFLNECFDEPEVIAEADPSDPQGGLIGNILKDKQGEITVLDYGCGQGRIANFLDNELPELSKRIQYIGYDPNEANVSDIDVAKFVNLNSTNFSSTFPQNQKVDILFCCNLIHELRRFKDIQLAYKQWIDVLADDGWLIIVEDSEFRVGETDFIMMHPRELGTLFETPPVAQDWARDKRIFGAAWNKRDLNVHELSLNSYRTCLDEVLSRSKQKANEIADKKELASNDVEKARLARTYGFYLAQTAYTLMRIDSLR